MMTRTDPYTPKVRKMIDERDGGRCQRCGVNVSGGPFSRHHRKARKMGGANRADAGRLSNVVTLCGSATTPGSCHQWVESNRLLALETGWLLFDIDDPSQVAVETTDRVRLRYDDGGGITFVRDVNANVLQADSR